jgi:hypothetical protein
MVDVSVFILDVVCNGVIYILMLVCTLLYVAYTTCQVSLVPVLVISSSVQIHGQQLLRSGVCS